jgi:transposase-like protein
MSSSGSSGPKKKRAHKEISKRERKEGSGSTGKGRKKRAKKVAAPSFVRPDWNRKDGAYWKQLFTACNNNRREGWRMYHETWESNFRILKGVNEVNKLTEKSEHEGDGGFRIPKHIKDEFISYIAKFDAAKMACPICLEPFTLETSVLTDCGHAFHADCLARQDNCPTCRGKFSKKYGSAGDGDAKVAATAVVTATSTSTTTSPMPVNKDHDA